MQFKYEVGAETFSQCASATLEQIDLLQSLYEKHAEHMTDEWKSNLLAVIHLTQSHASMLFAEIGLQHG